MTRKGKKTRRKPQAEGGDLWLSSYADMMSLLLCFFILFFSISKDGGEGAQEIKQKIIETFSKDSQDKVSKSEVGFKNETSEMRALQVLVAMLDFNDNDGGLSKRLEKTALNAKSLEEAKREFAEEFKKSGASKSDEKLELKKDKSVNIVIPSKVLFKSGSDTFKANSQNSLNDLAKSIGEFKDIESIEIVGHTDPTKPGSKNKFRDNWALSSARAGAVAQYLIDHGIPEKKLKAGGHAHLEPLFPNYAKSGEPILPNMKKNRRVEITLKKKIR